MICEPPTLSSPPHVDLSSPPHIDALPALRTAEAQAWLAAYAAVAEAEEIRIIEQLEVAITNATKLQRSAENLGWRLSHAKASLQVSMALETKAVAMAADSAPEEPRSFWLPWRGSRHHSNLHAQLLEQADAARARARQQRQQVSEYTELLQLTTEKAGEAAATVEEVTAMANEATAQADEAYKQANAQERVQSAMVDDVLTAGAHVALLAESIGKGALFALGIANEE